MFTASSKHVSTNEYYSYYSMWIIGIINIQDSINHNIILWLCQNSYWKWPFIVSFPIKNGDFP